MTFNASCLNWDMRVYLVTHRNPRKFPYTTEGINSFLSHIEKLIIGGVSVVQLREKELSEEEFISLANKVKKLTDEYKVKLVINDNINVAIACKANGLHIGQSDSDLLTALELTKNKMPIGVSVNTLDQAELAIKNGASYLGIGPVFPTNTKELDKDIIGTEGVKSILNGIPNLFPVVAISGININNVSEVMSGSKSNKSRCLDGVAMVSALMESTNPSEEVQQIKNIITLEQRKTTLESNQISEIKQLIKQVISKRPIIHHYTNLVAINDNANVTLSIGASPIMSLDKNEVEDVVKFSKGLLINIGTLRGSYVEDMVDMGKLYNQKNIPVILDPVGAGATKLRDETVTKLLKEVKISILKANASEIASIAGHNIQASGVDSITEIKNILEIAKNLAAQLGCVIVVTGETDYITDGKVGFSIHNGHHFMDNITASGCMLGSIIASYAAVSTDLVLAALIGVVVFTLAGQIAADHSSAPAGFKVKLMDELYQLTHHTSKFEMEKNRIKVIKHF